MRSLLIIRDSLRSLYSEYDYIIKPVSKFVLAFLMLLLLQGRIGYYERFSSVIVIAACSAICMFLPYGGISLICGLFLIADMTEVSYAMAGFSSIMLAMIFVLYYGFRPGTGIIMAMIPLTFLLKIPFVVPVILGMNLGIAAIVPAVFGILIWNLMKYFYINASELSAVGASDVIDSFADIGRGVLGDKYMLIIMFAFAVCIIVVSIISRSSMDHSWTISVIAGIAVMGILFLAADVICGQSVLWDLIGLIISFAILIVYELVIYSVDFRSTERLRFEDDDYYYFVKAVPKIKPLDEDERRD